MLRELAGLDHNAVHDWMVTRSDEAFNALRAGKISKDVYESICNWSIDCYFAWVRAEWLGIVGEEG